MDVTMKKLLQDVRSKLDVVPQLEEAMVQLEKDQAGILTDVKRQIELARQQAFDRNGRYRGAFACESEARSFGLLYLAGVAGNRNAASELERECPGMFERAMDTASDGVMIPTEFLPRFQALFETYGAADRNAFRLPLNRDTANFLRQTGDPTVYCRGEGTAPTASDIDVGNVTLTVKDWTTLTYVSVALMEDAAVELGEILARSIARAMAQKMDAIVFGGDGTSTYFGITGVVETLKDVDGAGTDSAGLVEAPGDDAFAEIDMAGMCKLYGTLPGYALPNAKWYTTPLFWANAMLRLSAAAGGSTIRDIAEGGGPQFLGHPVELVHTGISSTEADEEIVCLFGDLSQAVTIGDRKQMSVMQSEHYKFAEGQTTVLGIRRVAVNIHDVGDASNAGPIVGLSLETTA